MKTAAEMLRSAKKSILLMNGRALRRPGLEAAARIKAASGCDLMAATFPSYADRGAGLVPFGKLPYFPDAATAALSPYDTVLLAGMDEPVSFFGYEGWPSRFIPPGARKMRIDGGLDDAAAVLQALAEEMGAPAGAAGLVAEYRRPDLPSGNLTPEKACAVLAALQPEGAIVVDEGLTSAFSYFPLAATCAPHSYLNLTGGAIGQGIPCASGAALACPDRPVINLQADGSGMYTLQALWTQAREGSNVTTLVCSNRSYRIVQAELKRAGYPTPGPRAHSLTDLGSPNLDWTLMARGMGVPGTAVDTAEDLARELKKALAEPGPHLIEMVL